MHPEVQQDLPGNCPECGMALVRNQNSKTKTQNLGHGRHEGHSTSAFLRKFWVSLILTIPVIAYSGLGRETLKIRAPEFPASEYIPLILGSIVFFYGGWIFIASAWRELRGKQPGMMTLIAMATTVAYAYSIYALVSGSGMDLFWELTTLITVMLLGHYLEMRAVSGAQGALKELSKLLPDKADRLNKDSGMVEEVSLIDLKPGDQVLVRPGAKVPADGEIVDGRSQVNESMVTGESKPVDKKVGAKVIAGTINGNGALTVRVSEVGEKTFLAGIMRLVKEAQASKSRLQILSDRAAFYLTIVAIAAGVVTLVFWLLFGKGPSFAFERLVAVLVIACPHALGLAVPLVASISTTLAARKGFLVKQRLALEQARNIDIVLFDKTGTLTSGEFGVDAIVQNPKSKIQKLDILKLAASLNANSEHYIAKAIIRKARQEKLNMSHATNFEAIPGKGVKGVVEGEEILVGGPALLRDLGVSMPQEMLSQVEILAEQGKTVIHVIRAKELLGAIALTDLIRDESRQAVAELKKAGVKVAMVTGDSDDVAKWVARELGIDQYFAHVLPQEKSSKVKALQDQNLRVAMVGDGINDAPALTQADVGIAIGAGTNVAIESAGIILLRNDPRDIAKILRLSRATYSKMIQNLWWAAGYNIFAIPLAAGIFANQGFVLAPAFSAVLMSLSTVIVAVNALWLTKTEI